MEMEVLEIEMIGPMKNVKMSVSEMRAKKDESLSYKLTFFWDTLFNFYAKLHSISAPRNLTLEWITYHNIKSVVSTRVGNLWHWSSTSWTGIDTCHEAEA